MFYKHMCNGTVLHGRCVDISYFHQLKIFQTVYMNSLFSPENKFAAAYTNNNQTILLNTLVSEFTIIDCPFGEDEFVGGIFVLENVLVVYGQKTWCTYDMAGTELGRKKIPYVYCILSIVMLTRENMSIIFWSGDMKNPAMAIETYKGIVIIQKLHREPFLWNRI